MSDETNPNESGDDAAFEELVNSMSEGSSDEAGPVELSSVWEGYEYIWKKFNPSTVLTKGIVFTEYFDEDGKRAFRWHTSPDMAPWEALGMLQQAIMDVQAETVAQSFVDILSDVSDEDDEEDEEGAQ